MLVTWESDSKIEVCEANGVILARFDHIAAKVNSVKKPWPKHTAFQKLESLKLVLFCIGHLVAIHSFTAMNDFRAALSRSTSRSVASRACVWCLVQRTAPQKENNSGETKRISLGL